MILDSMESYDKGLLEDRLSENTSVKPDREILVQNWRNRDFQILCIIVI